MKPIIKNVANRPAYVLRNANVELSVTRDGAHMAPVNFYRDTAKPVQPYLISAWQYEKNVKCSHLVEELLRGDFFCLPFGGGSHGGKDYILHGESAVKPWTFECLDRVDQTTAMTLSMKTGLPKGHITHTLGLVDGQNVIYSRHLLEGFSGRFPMGHHATLAMPDEEGTVVIATSPKAFSMTYPIPPGDPAAGEYYSLAVGKIFKDLRRVPTIFQNPAFVDSSAYPRPRGYVDLVSMFSRPGKEPAWTTATFTKEGFLWFSLKDASVLPTTMLWSENHGRHFSPWSGRNNCLGIEDVAGFHALGMGPSLASNAATKAGIDTCLTLTPDKPTSVNYIQGAAKVPAGFDRVKKVVFGKNTVTFHGSNGKKVTVPVNHEFVWTGAV